METTVILDNFVSFADFDPTIDDNKCIYPAPSRNYQRCRKPVNRQNLEQARLIRNAVVASPSASGNLERLQKYCSLRCCMGLHREMLDSELARQVAQKWQRDLGVEIPEPQTIHTATTATSRASVGIDKNKTNLPPRASHVTHEYNLRSRVSQRRQTPPVSPSDPEKCAPNFEPYITKASQTVRSVLARPLSPREQNSGSLYMFTRSSSPGYVKIGLSKVSVAKRLSGWQTKCRYVPVLQHAIHNVPYVHRVELLIHFELAKHWRRERQCGGCGGGHIEWFEIDIEAARRVMDAWVKCIESMTPYDANGYLENRWRTLLDGLAAENAPITAQTLLDSMSSPALQSQGRVSGRTPVSENSRKTQTENTGVGVPSTPLSAHPRRSRDTSPEVTNILRDISALSATEITSLLRELEKTLARSPGSSPTTPAPRLPQINGLASCGIKCLYSLARSKLQPENGGGSGFPLNPLPEYSSEWLFSRLVQGVV